LDTKKCKATPRGFVRKILEILDESVQSLFSEFRDKLAYFQRRSYR